MPTFFSSWSMSCMYDLISISSEVLLPAVKQKKLSKNQTKLRKMKFWEIKPNEIKDIEGRPLARLKIINRN